MGKALFDHHSQRDSWTLSPALLSTSGKIRDEELENPGVKEATGGNPKGRLWEAVSTQPKGAGTPSSRICPASVLRIPPEPGNGTLAEVRGVSATKQTSELGSLHSSVLKSQSFVEPNSGIGAGKVRAEHRHCIVQQIPALT